MYAAQQTPGSTRITGAAITAGVSMLVAYALANGIGHRVTPVEQVATVMEFIDAPKESIPETPLPVEAPEIEIAAAPPVFEPPIYFPPEPPVIAAAPEAPVIDPAAATPMASSNRVAPKLRPGPEPPYPSQSARAQEEGVTGIKVCVDTRGRVTSASVASSSGHKRLDDAAVSWVRDARFTPGSIGGKAQPMCGHLVDYEWRLRNA